MPRRRNISRPRKPYERHIDLAPYQRVMRFLRWMSPTLTAMDVLRMLPESEAWTHEQLARYTSDLENAIAQGVEPWTAGGTGEPIVMVRPQIATLDEPLAALVPWAIIGEWTWPTKLRVIRGQTVYYQGDLAKGRVRVVHPHGLPHVRVAPVGFRPEGMEHGQPVWLDGQFPTIMGLCDLAADLKAILEDFCDTDFERIEWHWREFPHPFPRLATKHGARALCRLGLRISGKVTLAISLHAKSGRMTWSIQERIADYDFAVYGAWMLVQLIRDGQAWRVTRCTSCEAYFLRTRRDPPSRPARFCSDLC